jgi:hypothetical protein
MSAFDDFLAMEAVLPADAKQDQKPASAGSAFDDFMNMQVDSGDLSSKYPDAPIKITQADIDRAASDVPTAPGDKAVEYLRQRETLDRPKTAPESFGDKLYGAGEAALSTATGATTGALGMVAGTAKGLLQEGISLDTSEQARRARRVEESAMQGAQAGTFAPKTAAGQRYTQAVGEFSAPLVAIAPLSEIAAISNPAARAGSARTTVPSIKETAVTSAESAGISPMTSDLIPPTTFAGKVARAVGERIPGVGTGGQRAAQQSQRVDAVNDFLNSYSVGAHDAIPDVMSELLAKRSADISKYVGMKKDAFAKSGAATVDVAKTQAAIDAEVAKLKSLNSESVNPLIAKLEDYKKAFAGQQIDNVELLRKQLGDELQSADLASVRTNAGQAKSRIYGAVNSDISDHVTNYAGQKSAARWGVANKRLSEMMDELETTSIKGVLKKGSATPEVVQKLLFSRNPSDIKLLQKNLTPEGRSAAKIALMQEVAGKLDMNNISPERFVSSVDKLSNQTGILFSGVEKQQLKGLVDALKLTKQAGAAVAKPTTGAELTTFAAPSLLTYFLGSDPISGLAATASVGLLSRLYESRMMRDALLRISRAKTPKDRTDAYRAVIDILSASELSKLGQNQDNEK